MNDVFLDTVGLIAVWDQADQAGIVDQISFRLMRRLGLSEAFTNDQHFRAAGFMPLF